MNKIRKKEIHIKLRRKSNTVSFIS